MAGTRSPGGRAGTAALASLPALLAELARRGVKVSLADGGQIRVSAPRDTLSAELRAQISEHKPQLVDWLGRVRGGAAEEAGLPAIGPDPDGLFRPFPPSDLQMSYLVGSREGLEYYVRPHQYMEFDTGGLDPGRFRTALNQALARQRASLVVMRGDMLLETVRGPGPVDVPVTDLRGRPEPEAAAHMADVRAAMRRTELPLDRWPWLEARLTLYGPGRARLHYNHNNFFVDGPATNRFLEAVWTLYRNPGEPLPDIEISYRDCVLALAGLEESARGQASQKYWRDRIPALPGSPGIPLRGGADPRMRSRLGRRELVLPAEHWAALKQQAAARALTPSTAVYGAYAEIVARWSGSRHFLLNNMITRRLPLHPQIGEVFGNFASLYPLEVDWRHDEPFGDRARRLRAQVMEDVAHVYWSGGKVLQALNHARRAQGQAACPFVIGSGLFMGHMDRPYHSTLETPQVLLDCQFWEQHDGSLWLVWDLIEEMFPEGLIDAMQDGLLSLLTKLAMNDADWDATSFGLLPAGQRERRAEVNRPAGPVPDGLLHSCLPRMAADRPAKPALAGPGGTVSYGELYDRARRVAGALQRAGVRPGDLVAVVLPKGWEQVVAVLAVVTAGAAYVPADPGWPDSRLGYVLGDTAASAVLTSAALCDRIGGLTSRPVLAAGPLASGPGRPRAVAAPRLPGDLAYVIYTSGSTGWPKGARLSHQGPLNTITDINRRFGISPDDVLFGISSLCFDLSVYDIFGSIAAGATLVLPDASQTEPSRWVELARAHKVTVWNSVPALMELFAAAAEAAGTRLPALRTVLLSGDWIPVGLPERIRRIAPNARVVSLGGATEASIWSVCFPVDRDDPGWVSIPYGKPLANQTCHVLDAAGQDAPVWTAGDLYIGGAGVGLGYHNDRARTEAAFVPHPRTGERLYRTGDMARYLPGGDLEFLGRADLQVKIQGFRVEPGEAEQALMRHPAVRQAAVVARTSGSGRQLAAFVTLAPGAAAASPASLRDFAAGQLPGYLVPSHVTVVGELPLTGNGKLDRRALETRETGGPRAGRSRAAPVTATQAALASLWEEILSVSPIGIHDDFFELGGQSFAALRMSVLLAQQLGHSISLGILLERRTVAAVAEWLETEAGSWSPLVELRREAAGRPWFFVHPAGGNVLCYRELAALADRPFYAFQAPGPLAGREPLSSVADLAGEYLRALRPVQPHGPYLLGGWSSGAVIAFEIASQLERAGEAVGHLVVVDAPAPVARRKVADSALMLWFLEDFFPGFDSRHADAAAVSALAALPQRERLDAALELARRQGTVDGTVDRAAMAAILPVFGGLVRACGDYRGDPISADITLVRAQDGSVSEFRAHPSAGVPDWGWGSLSAGTVATVPLPATHHTVLTEPHVRAVAETINHRPQGARATG